MTKNEAVALCKLHDAGREWKIRRELAPCAAASGNHGFRVTFNNGYYDVLELEYDNAHTKFSAKSLVLEN